MGKTTITLRIEDELESAFQSVATEEQMSSADLLARLMRDYVAQHRGGTDYDQWFRREAEAGLASAREGRLIGADEVETLFAKRRKATQAMLHDSK